MIKYKKIRISNCSKESKAVIKINQETLLEIHLHKGWKDYRTIDNDCLLMPPPHFPPLLSNKSFWLSGEFEWKIGKIKGVAGLYLIPIKKSRGRYFPFK